MRRALVAASLVAASLVLASGCSAGLSPAEQLKDDTATVLDKANAGDVDGVHTSAAAMKSDIRSLSGQGKLSTTKARALLEVLNAIEANAESLRPVPTPAAPTASATASATPSPTPSATPSATASATPSAPPSPTPSATASPTASPTPAPAPTPKPKPTKKPTAVPLPAATLGSGLRGGEASPSPAG